MQTKLRTNQIEPNENISFPIGTLLLIERLYETLNFSSVFGKHKTRGIDINNLLQALVSYKMTDNFSIKRSHEWINRPEVLTEFSLPAFSERTLYRVLETLGDNREEIISDTRTSCLRGMILSILTSTWTGPVLFFTVPRLHLESMATVVIIGQIKNRSPLVSLNLPTRSISQLG